MVESHCVPGSEGKAFLEPEVLYDKLAGMTCEQIKEFCVSRGVKGYPGVESSCVLAKLFQKETSAQFASVNNMVGWAYDNSQIDEQNGEIRLAYARELTDEMRMFIHKFDDDQFPELVLAENYE